MNEGAKLVADSLLGLDYRFVSLGGAPRKVKAPTIKTICRSIRHFAQIALPGQELTAQTVLSVPDTACHLVRGLACFFEEPVEELLYECSPARLLEITQDIITLMSPDDFFACAALAKSAARMAATPRP